MKKISVWPHAINQTKARKILKFDPILLVDKTDLYTKNNIFGKKYNSINHKQDAQ